MTKNKNLSRIHSPLRRFFLGLYLSWLIFLGKFISKRALSHWVGRQHRPRRPERMFITFVLLGGFFALETHQLLLWVTAWGGAVSMFVIVRSFAMVIQK